MSQLEHITPEQVAQYGVVAAPDRLIGKPQDNKAVFDRLVRELVTVVVNAIIDKTNELLAAESVREENEQDRVAAEEARVSAETERIAAEEAREEAEETRQTNELHRENQEQYRQENERARQEAEQQRADETAGIVAQATQQAEAAVKAAQSVTGMARLAESWAVGGTGIRPGEDTDNAKYWSALAQVAASGENTLYVDAFGAVGDGVTDDTDAIQAAIDFAGENNLRILSFRHGRSYKITRRLNIDKEVSLHGNGAHLMCYVEKGHFLLVKGSYEDEIQLSEKASATAGTWNSVNIKLTKEHNYQPGDRIVIQSQRDALSEDSGLYWCGTPTAATNTCQFAEVLQVNKVISDTEIQCVGTLVYPYYYPDREDGVDVSTQPIQREHSTVRKVNFLNGIVIKDFKIDAYGESDNLTGRYDNTMIMFACADSVIKNVHLVKHRGRGRGMILDNCLNSGFIDCVVDSKLVYEDFRDSMVEDNHMSFSSTWYCYAENCTSYHAGQSFDVTYAATITEMERVRCPALYTTVRNCLVHGSIGSAATNHSGAFGCTYENSKFVNFGFPIAVRSPNTLIHGCEFSFKTTSDSDEFYGFAINISEPTTFGTRIENCLFACDRGICIWPHLDESLMPNVPRQKKKGIQILNNTFFGNKRWSIYVKEAPLKWNFSDGTEDGEYTDYAADRTDLEIRGNLFYRCGSGNATLVDIPRLVNGISISGNRFIDCVARAYMMDIDVLNTDVEIRDNVFSGCSGTSGFKYTAWIGTTDPRYEKLAPGGNSRHVYFNNISNDANFPACIPRADYNTVPDMLRVNGNKCGVLYSNHDAKNPGMVGWTGNLYSDGNNGNYMTFVVDGNGACILSSKRFTPTKDNLLDLGDSNRKWKDIYCVNGTINTSDRNEKTDIGDVPNEVLDAWGRVRYKRFLFSDAVEKKGEAARYHIGLIAQDIQEAFSAAGLNAEDYGLFCADTIVDENGQEKTVLGIRYSEALALECAYIRRRLDSSIFYQNI